MIGIADTCSGFNNCHRHFPELIEAVKRGVLATGGLPLIFPTISLGEVFLSPTSLMFRNLMAMDTEEMIRAQPMDAVVLVGGCDKTVPAQLMGAISANRPAIGLVAGPMLTSRWHGERLGACTDCRRFWAKYRAGEIDADEIDEIEGNLATTAGTCAVMGTASTMASIAEALGMILPGSAAIPAVHADRLRAAEATGRAAMQLAGEQAHPGPDRHAAIGRECAAGADGDRRLDQCGPAPDRDRRARRRRHRSQPAERDQRHDPGPRRSEADRAALHGGSVRRRRHRRGAARAEAAAASRLHDGRRRDLGERLAAPAGPVDRAVVKPLADPLQPKGGLVALFGSLAPKGAIFKRSAADPKLFEKEGRAVVFTSLEDLSARIDDPDLDVTPDDFLVLQNAGPLVASGMPEAGYLPIPAKLARAGVKDMVRISDARMSGTAYGSIVLARDPGRGERRPARQGAQRRPHPPLGRRAPPRPAGRAGGAGAPPDRPAAGARARLCPPLPPRDPAGRPRLRFQLPAQAPARRGRKLRDGV